MTSLFASYSDSFTPNTGTTIDDKVLDPSIIKQYEVGIKNDFWKGLFTGLKQARAGYHPVAHMFVGHKPPGHVTCHCTMHVRESMGAYVYHHRLGSMEQSELSVCINE